MVIVKHEVDTLTYAMPKIHWKYVSCGCHSTVHLQISALLRYYVHSVSVSPLGKKKSYRNTQHQVHYTCNTFDSTIRLCLPTAVKHPSSHPHVSKCQSFPLEATSVCLQSLYCFTQTGKETSRIDFF